MGLQIHKIGGGYIPPIEKRPVLVVGQPCRWSREDLGRSTEFLCLRERILLSPFCIHIAEFSPPRTISADLEAPPATRFGAEAAFGRRTACLSEGCTWPAEPVAADARPGL